MNAAHPFENPTPLTNTLHLLSMLLIPSALTFTFGAMIARRRRGWAFFAAFLVMFVGFLALVYGAEQNGNPLLAKASSTSMPRYLTVLSILVWPSRSWTALRLPVLR